MSLRTALDGEPQGCQSCGHLRTDPTSLEHALPGIAVLSSAYASVRGQDGLCVHHQRLINGRRRCDAFAPGGA